MKNAGSIQDDFWCLFLNLWNVTMVLIINSSNWILPGIYTPTYEICSRISQDYSKPQKFENTAMALSFATFLIYVFVTLRIKVFKHKTRHTIVPVEQNQIINSNTNNKLFIDLTLSIGSVLLIMAIFVANYIISLRYPVFDFSHNTFHYVFQFYHLLMIPIVLNLFVVFFYVKNEHTKVILLRECWDVLNEWKGQ